MDPNLRFPFNVRSFFTPQERKDIGAGVVLWRGYFQSVRPAIKQMLINVDISTGAMYKPGPLLSLCLEVLGRDNNPRLLQPRSGLPDRERLRLQRFIQNIKITTSHGGNGHRKKLRTVKRLSRDGSRDLSFTMDTGSTTVAEYFQVFIYLF
jgi:eukaryotic translation initiation factor 2C